ncbi:MAG: hypothetical protein OQK35_07565 [Alphaproteobacteria bacterium]|nr:hypothetical protein [Alphaproteobacteria bacterium]
MNDKISIVFSGDLAPNTKRRSICRCPRRQSSIIAGSTKPSGKDQGTPTFKPHLRLGEQLAGPRETMRITKS